MLNYSKNRRVLSNFRNSRNLKSLHCWLLTETQQPQVIFSKAFIFLGKHLCRMVPLSGYLVVTMEKWKCVLWTTTGIKPLWPFTLAFRVRKKHSWCLGIWKSCDCNPQKGLLDEANINYGVQLIEYGLFAIRSVSLYLYLYTISV